MAQLRRGYALNNPPVTPPADPRTPWLVQLMRRASKVVSIPDQRGFRTYYGDVMVHKPQPTVPSFVPRSSFQPITRYRQSWSLPTREPWRQSPRFDGRWFKAHVAPAVLPNKQQPRPQINWVWPNPVLPRAPKVFPIKPGRG